MEKYHGNDAGGSAGGDRGCHSGHASHMEHTGGGMGHGSAADFLRRFWIVTFLLLPLAATHPSVADYFAFGAVELNKWIQFGIATAIFGFSIVFFRHAWHEVRAREYGMMTLVSVAVLSGYGFSAVATFIPAIGVSFYLEISTLIWVLLFGHYLEARSGAAAGDALAQVAKLLPARAHRLALGDGLEEDVMVSVLSEGDVVVVKPGEKVPADGEIIAGSARFNESLITGESVPVFKKEGGEAVAGAIIEDSTVRIRIKRVGEHSTVGQIQKLIAAAQKTKPRSQRLADRAAKWLTGIAGLTALGALIVWFFVLGKPFVFAATLAITVLVIACPHALGLAIPTVTTITTSLAAKNGLFIKNLAKLEVLKRVDTVVMDKTGTLTEGEFGVSDIVSFGGVSEADVLAKAAAVDAGSSHMIARTVVSEARGRSLEITPVRAFTYTPGKGSAAEVAGMRYAVGSMAMAGEHGPVSGEARREALRLSNEGKTVVAVASPDGIIGIIGLSDTPKKESASAVEAFRARGIEVVMLTGDNERAASNIAKTLGIGKFFAEVLPEDKYRYIAKLQDEGRTVIMAGDGVNDAPALAQADVGVAIGAGTDVAVEAGDVVLTRSNPLDIVRLIDLSRAVYRKMIQNLLWALGYNIIAIPAAAGVFAAFGIFLRPEIGALVMSLSTVIVVVNALQLKRLNLHDVA